MICVKCGLIKKGDEDFFECEDCQKFSKLVMAIFEDIHEKMETASSIDPDTYPIMRLLADSTFITSKNPHTAIFYKISDYIVARAFENATEITEDELNRRVVTTRGWGDAFKIFEELNLVRIRIEDHRRVLILTEKTMKFAQQYLLAERISEVSIRIRLAHIYGGYVLLYILYKMAQLSVDNFNLSSLPYGQRPRSLWIMLMFLWTYAYMNNDSFDDEDLRAFVSKRRIPSTTRGKMINALEAKDGRSTQSLIKEVRIENNQKVFEFEDYVLLEMQRIREQIRERER